MLCSPFSRIPETLTPLLGSALETIVTVSLCAYIYIISVANFGNTSIVDQTHWTLVYPQPVGSLINCLVQVLRFSVCYSP